MIRPRLARSVWALAFFASASCSSARPPEIGEGPCSNGMDDDGDMLVDCDDPACQLFAWCTGSPDASAPDASAPDASGLDAGDVGPVACSEPLDLVLTLDVSSSMTEDVARLRDLSPAIFAAARTASTDARVSLVVFVDDALAVEDCAAFETPEALAAELDQWRAFTTQNRSPVSAIANVDCVENSLDAIATAITGCPRRAGGAHVVLHVTDDTFAERPTVLSGPFGPGVLVASTYVEVSDALAREDMTFVALTANGAGASCGGATISPDVGRGFHTPFGTELSLPERTRGEAWDLRAARAGTLDVAASLEMLLDRLVCRP